MFAQAPDYLQKKDVRLYNALSVTLYILFFVGLLWSVKTFLFPNVSYSFDFNNPEATRNTLFLPHLSDMKTVEKGKVSESEMLALYASNPHELESGKVRIWPSENTNDQNMEGAKITFQHGWSALFFPRNDSLTVSPVNVVFYENTYYERFDTLLKPFVSENAALSHLEKEKIPRLSPNEFASFQISEDFAGFRPGTMLAYADGVFIVSDNMTIRPFGSADILLRFGYSFDHVLPANAEEVGIYTREKIILLGQPHPTGTLFQESDTKNYYLLQNQELIRLENAYGSFLEKKNDIIRFSQAEIDQKAFCSLQKSFFGYHHCKTNITFSSHAGEDYRITLDGTTKEIDIATFSVYLQASQSVKNARYVATVIFQRILQRFGIE